MTQEELVQKYMALDGYTIPWTANWDYGWPGDAVPETKTYAATQGHALQAFLDGPTYFANLFDEMRQLKNSTGAYCYIHGWCFEIFQFWDVMQFEGKEDLPQNLKFIEEADAWEAMVHSQKLEVNSVKFYTLLKELHDSGVEVRIMGWMSPAMVKYEFFANINKEYVTRNRLTLYSFARLVAGGYLPATSVTMNTKAHVMGGCHAKFVVLGNNTKRIMYTGGVDIMQSRNNADWKDVTVKVKGPAAKKGMELFKTIWNEIVGQPAINISVFAKEGLGSNTDLPEQLFPTHSGQAITRTISDLTIPQNQTACVQMYKTLPRMNYGTGGLDWKTFFAIWKGGNFTLARNLRSVPHLFPAGYDNHTNGCFEYKTVLHKAILNAEHYVMVLDQCPINPELMDLIRQRMEKLAEAGKNLRVIIAGRWFVRADNGVSFGQDPNAVEAYKRLYHGGGDKEMVRSNVMYGDTWTHAKVVIVDDNWASIGSANAMRRSFYTDMEMGVSIADATWVKAFRKQLWGSWALGGSVPDDMSEALGMWNFRWSNTRVTAQFDSQKIDLSDRPRKAGRFGNFSKTAYTLSDFDANTLI